MTNLLRAGLFLAACLVAVFSLPESSRGQAKDLVQYNVVLTIKNNSDRCAWITTYDQNLPLPSTVTYGVAGQLKPRWIKPGQTVGDAIRGKLPNWSGFRVTVRAEFLHSDKCQGGVAFDRGNGHTFQAQGTSIIGLADARLTGFNGSGYQVSVSGRKT
jgi:hypothetical protein